MSMFQAAQAGGAVPLARLAWNEPWLIMRALDLGAAGVILPLIDNAGEAARGGRGVPVPAARPPLVRADPRRGADGLKLAPTCSAGTRCVSR